MTDRQYRHAMWLVRWWMRRVDDAIMFAVVQKKAAQAYSSGDWNTYAMMRAYEWRRWG